MNRFINMTIEELDNEIDKCHYIYQKALMYQNIIKVRKDYIPKYKRLKKGN